MKDEVKKCLHDVLIASDEIMDFTADIKFEDYTKNKLVQKAVEREFEIIGEALNKILKVDSAIVITDSRKIVNLRNYIIHAYDNVVNEILWGIIIKHLPKLEEEVKVLLIEGDS